MHCSAPNAMPTLNSASESLKVSGLNDPVRTMVLPRIEARYCAVWIMVSVPCVISILVSEADVQRSYKSFLELKCVHVYNIGGLIYRYLRVDLYDGIVIITKKEADLAERKAYWIPGGGGMVGLHFLPISSVNATVIKVK